MTVDDSWHAIVKWLSENAPRTAGEIEPPASEDELRAAEANFPQPWPEELCQWYRLHDGATSRQLFAGVLPGYAHLLPLRRIPKASREYVEIYEAVAEQYEDVFADPASLDAAPAGSPAGRFLPSWVPIAKSGTAWTLFVDCRSGEKSGCVTSFEREDADWGGPTWTSVGSMLADIAEALESGRACGGWRPRVDETGVLEWEPAVE